MDEVSANQPLDYAPPPPWRKRKVARRLFALAVLLAVLVSAWQVWPSIAARCNLLALQRSCLGFLRDGQQPVFSQAASADQRGAVNASLRNRAPGAVVADWRRLVQAVESGALQSDGTLFLHERTSASGQRRLVGVDLRVTWTPQVTIASVAWRVIVPAGILSKPRETISVGPGGYLIEVLRPDYGRKIGIYPGQPDPTDASRFTIPFEVGESHGTIVGRLLDGNHVELTVNAADDSPTTNPQPP